LKAVDKYTNHNDVAGTNEPILQRISSLAMDAARSEPSEAHKRN
jgi:hypothetical protein